MTDLFDSLFSQNPEALAGWSIEKLAEKPGRLPEKLSIKQIAALSVPQDTKMQNSIIQVLIDSCKKGQLEYYGDIQGWAWGGDIKNPYSEIKGAQVMPYNPSSADIHELMRNAMSNKWRAAPADCLIHRDEFERGLKRPINGLLANWWPESELHVETDSVTQNEELKPWLIADPNDPQPKQSWYIPARYFARQLVKDDSTLLTKRNKLAVKVVQSLSNAGIKKRGGVNPFDASTVLKALIRVYLG